MWFHCGTDEMRWIPTEQHELQDNLKVAPFLESKRRLKIITQNPIISAKFDAWRKLHMLVGHNTKLLMNSPLMKNPNILAAIVDRILQDWTRRGIKIIDNLYANNIF